jgi:hypothetical protein
MAGGRGKVEPRWKKGESGNPKGRPKNIATIIQEVFIAEHNLKLSKGQVNDIIQVILSKNKKELIEMAKNEELPFWVGLIARKAQRDYEKGSIHILDVLFDRVYGAPTQSIEQKIIEQPLFPDVSTHNSNQQDTPDASPKKGGARGNKRG